MSDASTLVLLNY